MLGGISLPKNDGKVYTRQHVKDPYSSENLAVASKRTTRLSPNDTNESAAAMWRKKRREMKKQLGSELQKPEREPKHIKMLRYRNSIRERATAQQTPKELVPAWIRRAPIMLGASQRDKAGSHSSTWKSAVERNPYPKSDTSAAYHGPDATKLSSVGPAYTHMFASNQPRFATLPSYNNRNTARFSVLKPSYVESSDHSDHAQPLSTKSMDSISEPGSQVSPKTKNRRSKARPAGRGAAVLRGHTLLHRPLGRFADRRNRSELYVYSDIIEGTDPTRPQGNAHQVKHATDLYDPLAQDVKHWQRVNVKMSSEERFARPPGRGITGINEAPRYGGDRFGPVLSDFGAPLPRKEARRRKKRLDAVSRFADPEFYFNNDPRFSNMRRTARPDGGLLSASTMLSREDKRVLASRESAQPRPSAVFKSPPRGNLFQKRGYYASRREYSSEEIIAATASTQYLASLGSSKRSIPLDMLEQMKSPDQEVVLMSHGKKI